MTIKVDETKMYQLIKKAVTEAFEEKIEKLRLEFIPYVDDNEMEEIKSIFGSPEKYVNQNFEEVDP